MLLRLLDCRFVERELGLTDNLLEFQSLVSFSATVFTSQSPPPWKLCLQSTFYHSHPVWSQSFTSKPAYSPHLTFCQTICHLHFLSIVSPPPFFLIHFLSAPVIPQALVHCVSLLIQVQDVYSLSYAQHHDLPFAKLRPVKIIEKSLFNYCPNPLSLWWDDVWLYLFFKDLYRSGNHLSCITLSVTHKQFILNSILIQL